MSMSHYEPTSTRQGSHSAFQQLLTLQSLMEMVQDSVPMSAVDRHFAIKRARQAQQRLQQHTEQAGRTAHPHYYRPQRIPRHTLCQGRHGPAKKDPAALKTVSAAGHSPTGRRQRESQHSSDAEGQPPLQVVVSMQHQLTQESEAVTAVISQQKNTTAQAETDIPEPGTAMMPMGSTGSLHRRPGTVPEGPQDPYDRPNAGSRTVTSPDGDKQGKVAHSYAFGDSSRGKGEVAAPGHRGRSLSTINVMGRQRQHPPASAVPRTQDGRGGK